MLPAPAPQISIRYYNFVGCDSSGRDSVCVREFSNRLAAKTDEFVWKVVICC